MDVTPRCHDFRRPFAVNRAFLGARMASRRLLPVDAIPLQHAPTCRVAERPNQPLSLPPRDPSFAAEGHRSQLPKANGPRTNGTCRRFLPPFWAGFYGIRKQYAD
jgi:hypothetical protein